MTRLPGRSVLATIALGLFAAAWATPAVASPRLPSPGVPPEGLAPNATSSNWAGYDVKGGPFRSVSAAWVQSAVTCHGGDTWSSFWVGIDGDGSNTVEQTGTAAECHGGRPVYYAWYEMFPAFPKRIPLPVAPGDRLSASVTTTDGHRFVLTLRNTSRGVASTTTKRSSTARLASAEVIAEAPSSRAGVLPLADFGTVAFSSSMVDGRALGLRAAPNKITMASGGVIKASVSNLGGGTDFSVTFHHS